MEVGHISAFTTAAGNGIPARANEEAVAREGGRYAPVRRVLGSEPLIERIQFQECRSRVPGSISSGLTPTLREDWTHKRALEPCHARIASSHVSGPLVKIDMGHCIRRGL